MFPLLHFSSHMVSFSFSNSAGTPQLQGLCPCCTLSPVCSFPKICKAYFFTPYRPLLNITCSWHPLWSPYWPAPPCTFSLSLCDFCSPLHLFPSSMPPHSLHILFIFCFSHWNIIDSLFCVHYWSVWAHKAEGWGLHHFMNKDFPRCNKHLPIDHVPEPLWLHMPVSTWNVLCLYLRQSCCPSKSVLKVTSS
jgi:hypothetical protein